jgi:3-methyl-2-oxobutanoate hydroxymethyltransferase
LTREFHPRFVRRYAELADVVGDAVRRYVADVRAAEFPSEGESY